MAPPASSRFTTSSRPLADQRLDVIAIPVLSGGAVPQAARAALEPAPELERIAARLALETAGQTSWVCGERGAPDLLLVCAGPARGDGEASADGLREAAMVAGQSCGRRRIACLLAMACSSNSEAATIAAEGWVLGAYRFDRYRDGAAPPPTEEVVMWGCDPQAVAEGVIFGEATCTVRDLVNTPAGELPPSRLAEACRELGSRHGFGIRVRERGELERERFGGLLAVGAGSAHPPLLIELERGDPEPNHLALVGKGITFDAGGLSLKSTDGMRTMKGDMAGAAAIVGALVAADRLGLPNAVRAYLACAENMPGSSALRVGDVVRHRNGLTTEVLDTDCEGRLVLADALAYAAESRPSALVDLATISSYTGLGPELWALLGTDQDLCERLLEAGTAAGEPGWQLPLWEGYEPSTRSKLADLQNYDPASGPRFGSVFAALYLRHFVARTPWAHIDLGLTNMVAEPSGGWSAGANGKGTRTLIRFLKTGAAETSRSGEAHQRRVETSSP